jgi:hypothetical protein
MRKAIICCSVLVLSAAAINAEEITCQGSITSIQGEGLVTKTHRFEVAEVSGGEVMAVLDKCKKIAVDRQNKASKKNPFGNFRKASKVDLACVQGSEKFQLRRSIQTRP